VVLYALVLSAITFSSYPGETDTPAEVHLRPAEENAPVTEGLENDRLVTEPPIEDPVITDASISDHNETDNNEDYESSKGYADAISDKPFQGKPWNSAIGLGGGSGGTFGGRFGGRRQLKAFGGVGAYKEGRKRFEKDPGVSYPGNGMNTESYDHIRDNPFLSAQENPLSTFSIDVDTASYANVRRYLRWRLPPRDAVRIEEMINYFDYDYEPSGGPDPFAVHVEIGACPWKGTHRLVRVGLKGRVIPKESRPPANLVFLIDVSGSMQPANKLPLLVRALRLLVRRLGHRDRVAIAVYAGASGLALPSTSCERKSEILATLGRLRAGGSTHGSAGIRLAYDTAEQNFIRGGVNRVILATDGDFNVGVTNRGELVRLIEEKAKTGVFLSVLGFGMGNYKDATLEQLADKGNGNYAYIDTLGEARKVLVEEMDGTLITIAKDVKIQVEFNPLRVGSYRLIGYENRLLRKEDFNNDKKDAGEIGAGHRVTALYEIVPAEAAVVARSVDPLRYQEKPELSAGAYSGETLTLKIRYKEPEADTSRLLTFGVTDQGAGLSGCSEDFHFAAAVASFGMLLRASEHSGEASFESVLALAEAGLGEDRFGYRAEFIGLVQRARALADREE
jgi:Ca-activated chloride channel family protein